VVLPQKRVVKGSRPGEGLYWFSEKSCIGSARRAVLAQQEELYWLNEKSFKFL